MKVHMFRRSESMAGPVRTYCGRVDDDGRLGWVYEAQDVDCETCLRAMTRDYCRACRLPHVAWEPGFVCQCGTKEWNR